MNDVCIPAARTYESELHTEKTISEVPDKHNDTRTLLCSAATCERYHFQTHKILPCGIVALQKSQIEQIVQMA